MYQDLHTISKLMILVGSVVPVPVRLNAVLVKICYLLVFQHFHVWSVLCLVTQHCQYCFF